MSITGLAYVKIHPFKRKTTVEQVMLGRWSGELILTGDGTGGYVQAQLQLSQAIDFFGGNVLWNLENFSFWTNTYIAGTSTGIYINDGELGHAPILDSCPNSGSGGYYGNAINANYTTAYRHYVHKMYSRGGSAWTNSTITIWFATNQASVVYSMYACGFLFDEALFNGVDNLPIKIP